MHHQGKTMVFMRHKQHNYTIIQRGKEAKTTFSLNYDNIVYDNIKGKAYTITNGQLQLVDLNGNVSQGAVIHNFGKILDIMIIDDYIISLEKFGSSSIRPVFIPHSKPKFFMQINSTYIPFHLFSSVAENSQIQSPTPGPIYLIFGIFALFIFVFLYFYHSKSKLIIVHHDDTIYASVTQL
jgi:hypothetical protein